MIKVLLPALSASTHNTPGTDLLACFIISMIFRYKWHCYEVCDGSSCGETRSAKVCFYTASQKNNVLSFIMRFTLLQTQQVLCAYFFLNYLQPIHLVE
jgi:hypothetical protein